MWNEACRGSARCSGISGGSWTSSYLPLPLASTKNPQEDTLKSRNLATNGCVFSLSVVKDDHYLAEMVDIQTSNPV